MPTGIKDPVGTIRRRSDGYYRIKVAENKWDLLHRVMWREANGPIPRGFIVHHIDEDRGHNELSNFELKSSQSVHLSEHMKGKPKSPEHRARIAAALRGRKQSPEHVENWHRSRWG
jgi:hypothetical protein